MRVGTTNTGKKFVFDRATLVTVYNGQNFYKTFAGNIVREEANGTFTEIAKAVAEQHILLMPYAIAAELFPANANLVENI